MSNSQKDNLEDVSIENNESVPEAKGDSTSNKKTRFTKSKSISKVFKELEEKDIENSEYEEEIESVGTDFADSSSMAAEGIDESSMDDELLDPVSEDIEVIEPISEDIEVIEPISEDTEITDFSEEDSSVDEIIPIHNEYNDLDKSEAFDEDLAGEEEVDIFGLDSSEVSELESNVTESENIDSKENLEAIDGEGDSIGSDDFDSEGSFIRADESSEDLRKDIKPSSGVLLNKDDESLVDEEEPLLEFNSSTIFSVIGLIVGVGILFMGIAYFRSSSDRVVDNVLSGETAGLAVFLIIIGLIILLFGALRLLSSMNSSKTSSLFDMLNSIRDIDYDDVNDGAISRDDFSSVFSGLFGRNKNSTFSDDDEYEKYSVDKPLNLNENEDEETSDDADVYYSDKNLNSEKRTSSFKNHDSETSTEDSADFDDNSIADDSMDDFADDSVVADDSIDDFADDSVVADDSMDDFADEPADDSDVDSADELDAQLEEDLDVFYSDSNLNVKRSSSEQDNE